MKPSSLALAVLALSLALSQSVFAGPLEDAKAKAHLDAVAAGNLDALMADYPDDAYMDWIGGPLDGRYRGKAAIREVWRKFIAANAGQPRPAKFGKLESYANPQGASIEGGAEYGGAKPVKAWHALVYRDGSLTTEIWQVAPTLQVAP
ncbi:MAG: nuclear transport factor 2 family protein [Sulfuricella sp.]|nr:nuclear transport factor 2 family protein [Sulfuricella sp.]